jgi:hypothetical protein
MREYDDVPVLDPGNAPEVFCYGLAKVEHLGAIGRFHLFTPQLIGTKYKRVINMHIDMPIESIAPGIELTLATFGARLIRPIAGHLFGKLAS